MVPAQSQKIARTLNRGYAIKARLDLADVCSVSIWLNRSEPPGKLSCFQGQLIPSGDGEHLNKEERCRAFNFKAASSRRDRGLKAAVARFGFFDACVHDEAMTERRR